MLAESLTALAAATGAGIVQAAGTDVWTGLRDRVARLLGRERPEPVLERLDRTRRELEEAGADDAERTAQRQEAAWQVRIEDFLDAAEEAERDTAAARLRELLAWLAEQQPEQPPAPGTTVMNARASGHGRTYQAGRDITVHEK
ncbi:hypothetical protein ACFWBN_37190 [Streptomyces sp. NPDC059989]|uniref:hypothetical protein n=1 Tax=Streptomyces sp. NPDC059989 TaxID=3347026 RepID=UPI0036BCF2BE